MPTFSQFQFWLDPFVFEDIYHCYSLERVGFQHSIDKIARRSRNQLFLDRLLSPLLDISQHVKIVCRLERLLPSQHKIQHRPTGPYIHLWSNILLVSEHLCERGGGNKNVSADS